MKKKVEFLICVYYRKDAIFTFDYIMSRLKEESIPVIRYSRQPIYIEANGWCIKIKPIYKNERGVRGLRPNYHCISPYHEIDDYLQATGSKRLDSIADILQIIRGKEMKDE